MAINFNKHRDALIAAWKDVLDEKTDTDWALFGYDGLSNDLKFVSKGDGGLTELIDDFNSGKIQYAFFKLDVPDSSISKYVLINWQGEGAPTVRKGTCANHIKDVAQFFTGFHLTMHARTEDDLEERVILEKLAKAGSNFNFKSRTEELPPSGPVGTAYKKVNPVQEINSSERDQFWLKEEQEEKKRVEAERKRRDEEKRKAEEDARRKEELAAQRRAKVEEQKSPSPEPLSPTGVSASECLRRQRSHEARALCGASTAAARKLFQQNTAQGQLSHKSNSIPEKPVRSSVIAQRINTFTPQPTSLPPLSPSNRSPKKITLAEEPQEQPKTSPLKNIDKIKMSLETPSQIQYEPIIDPTVDLSPSTENEPTSFSAINYSEMKENEDYRPITGDSLKQSEPMIKQNILENDMFDASYSSSNENDDDDSDNKFSTIKRSPYSKNNIAEENGKADLSRQNTVIENVNYKKEANGTNTSDDVSPEGLEDEGTIYEDLDDDPGLTARALYDYQAADDSEITFDPGDIITHIEQIDSGWWQGVGPQGVFGLFPANYVELLPCHPLHPR